MRLGWFVIAFTFMTLSAHGQEGARGAGAPPAIASAGVTQTEWAAVRREVARQARRAQVSETALLAAAEAAGATLAGSGRFEALALRQVIIDGIEGQANQIAELQARLRSLEADTDPSIARIFTDAREALERGQITEADRLLASAAESDLAGLARADAEIERRRLRAGDTVAARGQVAYLRADFIAASDFMARAASIVPQSAVRARWSYLSLQADALRQRGELFSETARLRESVRIFRELVLPLAPRAERPDDWATTQMGLGIALDLLGEHGDRQATQDAVAANRATLEVWTESGAPMKWAGAQTNLGAALNTLGERGDEQALREAIAGFRAALRVSTRQVDPVGWAALQNNLSVSYRWLGEMGDVRALEDATAAARAALEVDTRERDPVAWAKDQINLGNALSASGERGDPELLRQSVAAYRGALEVLTRDRDATGWAAGQTNLGNALYLLGREGDERLLHEAIMALNSALGVFTRENAPAYWASTQNNLGRALVALGERGGGSNDGLDAIRSAVDAHRESLTVNTRELAATLWARDQANLGDALNALGRRTNNASHLRAAVSAYRAALEVQSRERNASTWASTRANLGVAYLRLGLRGEPAAFASAVVELRAALEVLTPTQHRLQWATTQSNLGIVLVKLGDAGDRARYREAITAFRAALEGFSRDSEPEDWATTQARLGDVLVLQGQAREAITAFTTFLAARTSRTDPHEWASTQRQLGDLLLRMGMDGDERALEGAISAYRAALQVWTRERDGAPWGGVQGNLGNALTERFYATGDATNLDEAVLAFRRALSVVTRESDPATWATRQYNLAATLHVHVEHGQQGRRAEALTAARAALEGFREVQDVEWSRRTERLVADLSAAR